MNQVSKECSEWLLEQCSILTEAAMNDIEAAIHVCGGDGKGCPAYRPYYGGQLERRYGKCSSCPMAATFHIREALKSWTENQMKVAKV